MKNKNMAVLFCLYLVFGGVVPINCMKKGKLIYRPPLEFEVKIEPFDRAVSSMHLPIVTNLKEAEKRLTELNKQRKELNSIQYELNLPDSFQQILWRRQGLELYTNFYAKKVQELQKANQKRPKKRQQKKGVLFSDDTDSFLDQCIVQNKQQRSNAGKTSTNNQSVATPELLTKDEQRKLLLAESRKKRAERAAFRGPQPKFDKWCEDNPSDSDSGSDDESPRAFDQMQNIPFCHTPVKIMDLASAKAAAEHSKDRIQAASLDPTWFSNKKEVNVDAYYLITDGATEIALTESGNFPAHIKVVNAMRFNENYIYLSSVETKVGCDENGTYYFMSQKFPGKAYPITNIYAIQQDPDNPMTKYFSIKKEYGQIKLFDNNERAYRLNLDNDIEFESCDDPSKRYSLKVNTDGYYLHDKQANEEYLLFHGHNLQNQFSDAQYRREAYGRVDSLLRRIIPQGQLMALLGKKFVELETLL